MFMYGLLVCVEYLRQGRISRSLGQGQGHSIKKSGHMSVTKNTFAGGLRHYIYLLMRREATWTLVTVVVVNCDVSQ